MAGKFHKQRSLVGYSPWGPKELDVTEHTHAHTHTHTVKVIIETLELKKNKFFLHFI